MRNHTTLIFFPRKSRMKEKYIKKNKQKQNKTKQNKTKQNKTKQNKTKQNTKQQQQQNPTHQNIVKTEVVCHLHGETGSSTVWAYSKQKCLKEARTNST